MGAFYDWPRQVQQSPVSATTTNACIDCGKAQNNPSAKRCRPCYYAAWPERFWIKTVRLHPRACWLWHAATYSNGYGVFFANGRLQPAHRVAYELAVGPIPDGLTIDHKCRTRRCVNPGHLEAVSPGQNLARRINPMFCKRGHARPLDGGDCKKCKAEVDRIRNARKAAA